MYRMKDDMSGAAAVLGLFSALPKLALPVEVHGLIAATENMPSGTAQRPGDIVRAMNGLTIEIGNTDAEGRLTLADALVYADKEIKPDEMLDLATLTGAIVVALGMGLSGVFVTDDALADRVLGAAETAGEKMWRMPLHDEYKDGIKSDIADLNNISSQRGGGAIVAGLFMRDFTGAARGRISTSRAPPSPSANCPSVPRAPRASGCGPSSPISTRSRAGGRCRAASTSTRTPRPPTARIRRRSWWWRRRAAACASCHHGPRLHGRPRGGDGRRGIAPAARDSPGIEINCDVEARRSTCSAISWTGRPRGSRSSAASSDGSGGSASIAWRSVWPRWACPSMPRRCSPS
jgi:hypothetical protein